MPRVKRGTSHVQKRKKVLKTTKGFFGRRKNVLRLAKEASTKSGAYAYRDRRTKKRVTRRLWQTQLNNAVRQYDLTYSKFIHMLKQKQIDLDRKVLSQLARQYPETFKKFIEFVKQ